MDLDLLLPQDTPGESSSWRWGTVTQLSPLRVRLDGDSSALSVTPDLLTSRVAGGSRVLVQIVGRRAIVHGPEGLYDAWISYTPILRAGGTALGYGSAGSATGAYKITDGSVCHWRASIGYSGTGVSAGSGQYDLLLPPVSPAGGFPIVGQGWLYGAAGFALFTMDGPGYARMIHTSGSVMDQSKGPTASGHVLSAAGTYQI